LTVYAVEVPGGMEDSKDGADDTESYTVPADADVDTHDNTEDTDTAAATAAAGADDSCAAAAAAGGPASLGLPQVGYYQLLCLVSVA